SFHDPGRHPDRVGARDREVSQRQEDEEGAGVDSRRSGARDVAVARRSAGGDSRAQRTRLRRLLAVRKLSVTSAFYLCPALVACDSAPSFWSCSPRRPRPRREDGSAALAGAAATAACLRALASRRAIRRPTSKTADSPSARCSTRASVTKRWASAGRPTTRTPAST